MSSNANHSSAVELTSAASAGTSNPPPTVVAAAPPAPTAAAAPQAPANQPPVVAAAAPAPPPATEIRKARQGLRGGGQGDQHFRPTSVSIGAYHRHAHSDGKRALADRLCPPHSARWGRVRGVLIENQLTASNNNGRDWYPDNTYQQMEDYFSFSATDGRMPLLDDGCYVLHFLVDYHIEQGTAGVVVIKDPLRDDNENSVMRDILFLLENQVPWCFLRAMHGFLRPPGDQSDVGEQLAQRVQELLEDRLYTISGVERRRRPPSVHIHHLLHLVHHYLKPTTGRQEAASSCAHLVLNVGCCRGVEDEEQRMGRWRRATEYRRYAFVKLKRRKFNQGEVESILDVRLEGGTLWIPTLRIDDLTPTLLRNLIALEDRMQMTERPVTAYCLFMSQLACKVEDVELLQRLDILQNFLAADEDVVQAFADICKGVVLHVDDHEMNYLNGTWHELQNRCRTAGNTFFGLFFEKNCSNSLHIFAFIAAVLLFVFQAAQVVFAVLSYLHKK